MPVVEDDGDAGAFATQPLAELRHETMWPRNTEQALAGLARHARRFDVLFSDVIVPGMNGIDLASNDTDGFELLAPAVSGRAGLAHPPQGRNVEASAQPREHLGRGSTGVQWRPTFRR